jgi:anti-anti-sigma factor
MSSPEKKRTVPYTAKCSRSANQVLVRVSGRLVNPHGPVQSWPECLQQPASDVQVDLGEVTQIDARGLGMLADLTRRMRAHGGRVAVVSANPRVRRLLRLTQLDALLDTGSAGPRQAA